MTVLCHACLVAVPPPDALRPYFAGWNRDPHLTVEAPCPRGSEIVERLETADSDRAFGFACAVRGFPRHQLAVTFYPDGTLAAYTSKRDGLREGFAMRWHPGGKRAEYATWRDDRLHGEHVVLGEDGVIETTSYVDGVREGSYTRRLDARRTERGAYRDGEKHGIWQEWRADGSRASGVYRGGVREGRWELTADPGRLAPDATVTFAHGRAVEAEQTVDRYHLLVGLFDAAWLGLAYYGERHDRAELVYLGGLGLALTPPLVHAIKQPGRTRRRVVAESYGVRPGMTAAVISIYTIGKLVGGARCDRRSSTEDGEVCTDYGYDFNTDYNWRAVFWWSAVLVGLADTAMAFRTEAVDANRVWPALGVIPTRGGATVGVSGRF